MKKLLVLIFLVNVSFTLVARESDTQKEQRLSERQGPDFEIIKQLLELDEVQADQLKTLMDEQKTKHQAKRALEQTNRQAQREERREEQREDRKLQHETNKQQLLNILNQEQFEKFENYMQQFRPKRPRQ